MGYAEQIIHELLMEEVQQNNIINAIKKRHEVSFVYNNGDGDSRGKQGRITVQPVAYGTTKAGNPCFRGYQTLGSSESKEKGEGEIPGWRLFLLDRVVDNTWKDTGKVFSKPPMFNEKGDRSMSNVLLIADFEGTSARYERGGLKRYNTARHDKKVQENPLYDFQKQVNKKTMAPNYVLKNLKDTAVSPQERERQWNAANAERMKGNQQSIDDMSKQKDFGNNEIEQTVGPQRKGERSEVINKNNTPNSYVFAAQNGPRYKGEENNDIENQDTDEYR